MINVDPSGCERKMVYQVQSIEVGVGDRLRWTKNNRTNGIRNGQTFTVNQIDSSGMAQITDTDGKQRTINLTGKQHIDYAWVNTTYSSQGKTAERVLVLMDDTTTHRESFYVAISRANHSLT
jgi:ATP-dependent exoDNAse (exonuclease V) alpha subunit